MGSNVKLILFVPLAVFAAGASADAGAQTVRNGRPNASDVNRPSAGVCKSRHVNGQVREALRLVCAQTASDKALASAHGLIVIGFLGGFTKNGEPHHPEVWFGAYLRERYPSAAAVSVLSNHQRRRTMTNVLNLLDTDHNGVLTDAEKSQAKIILFGHSWGASETEAFAKELEKLGIPVLLTIQIDIVPKPGQQPILIPANVHAAINFFQSEGLLRGRPEIAAEDPRRTEVIGNLRMRYQGREVDCRNYPWLARTFNKPHHEIENDARVWDQIALLIDARLSSFRSSWDRASMH